MNKAVLIRRVLSFLLKLCVVLLCMAGISLGSFQVVTRYLTGEFYDFHKKESRDDTKKKKASKEEQQENLNNENIEATLVFVDSSDFVNEYITMCLYNKETKAFDLVLLPEDAEVEVSPTLASILRQKIPDMKNKVSIGKISSAFGDEKYEKLVSVVSELSGMKMGGYDVMSAKDFGSFIDACGKVQYKTTQRMSYRNENGELEELPAGLQKFDGDSALIVLSYHDGTEDQESRRLETTSGFLNELLNSVVKKGKQKEAGEAYQKYAQTHLDKGVTSPVDILAGMQSGQYMTRIMQGNVKKGIYQLDAQKVQLQLSALIKQTDSKKADGKDSDSKDTAKNSESDSKDCSIEIYNAAYVSGLAGGWKEYLTSEGYNITVAGTYQDEGPISETRIRVTEEGMGEDLLAYFPNAEITVVETIPNGGDIAIYVGTDYTDVPEVSSENVTSEDEETDYSFDDDNSEDSSDDVDFDNDNQ